MEHALDVALLIPSWSKVQDWKELQHVYIHQRPLATGPGARVWLCKDRRLVWSYRIDGFVELRDALPGDTDQEEAGWALQVSDGRRASRDVDGIADPNGVAARWMQGFRYLESGATAFVRAPRRPRAKQSVAEEAADVLHVRPAPNGPAGGVPGLDPAVPAAPADGSWAARLARRLGRRG